MSDSIERINYLKATVRDADADTRIKKWLLKHYRHIVQSQDCCRRAFHRKEVSVNGQLAEETRILRAGDVVEVRYDRAIVEREKMKAIPVDIRYQDEHMAIVWKAPGLSGLFEKALIYALTNTTEQEKFWCPYSLQKAASGLLVVAKTEKAKEELSRQYQNGEIDLTMRAICHGRVPPDLLDHLEQPPTDPVKDEKDDASSMKSYSTITNKPENNDDDGDDGDDQHEGVKIERSPTDLLKSISIVNITRSNHAEYLSTVDLAIRTPLASTPIRRVLYGQQHPIVGNSTYTRFLKSSKDKGLCMSVIHVALVHPITKQPLSWQAQEPDKFELLRAREHKFWGRRMDEKLEAMRKAGVSMDGTGGDEFVDDMYQEGNGKPLAYRLGEKEFCQLKFKVTEACLVPRPSSETLVRATVDLRPKRVLDIGTGCGNLLLSILHMLHDDTVAGVGLDISADALQVARENASRLGLAAEFVEKDMSLLPEAGLGLFDVVVCNPPYLSEKAVFKHRMLEHEPATALFANDDGYEWYTVLSKVVPTLMHRQSKLVLECGKGMMERVQVIMAGWKTVEVRKDSQGWSRCLVLEME
ncbi:S-adenosyl-L-methionine-dependent methyltransferase [Zychaea mexicana]|uniref:S-adenosyl-L-methionine-dependent methyltransferase n=1 Tax=Zychaea mexicana TaxID=64656 RepID=UPI0022FE20C9|nr:S-adenosyl-L-methionine-dependent methyltransferase [Zychaea mexicana]KAI9469350.1 S-adenosyl-L-methionine-dependent methyltransferase [Zychaea mexicana]